MPGRNLRLLSLDGGGIRGLSSLELLRQLMVRINPKSPPKPCEYFDMIGGTSTGGLIAIMLGRLEMSVNECIDAYCQLSKRVFQQTRSLLNFGGRLQGRFDAKELELAIKEVLRNRGLDENTLLKSDSRSKCKVFVCATSFYTKRIVHFTSYPSSRGSPLLDELTIWEAGRATSAATTFFDPIKIGNPPIKYLDGATAANNPVKESLMLAADCWECPIKENLKCLVSIGTGRPSMNSFGDTPREVGASLIALSTETEQIAESFSREYGDLEEEKRYFRFNVERGLEHVGLEKTKDMGKIIDITRDYIQTQRVKISIDRCAKQLKPSGMRHFMRSLACLRL